MGKIKYLFFFLGGVFLFILGTQKIQAAPTSEVIINEVMANPSGSDTNHEWLEFQNIGSAPVDLKNWQLEIYNTSLALTKTIIFTSVTIAPDNYLVVLNNSANYSPCTSCVTYDAGTFSLTNSKGKVILKDTVTNSYEFSWAEDVGDGFSMEIIGPPTDPDFLQFAKSSSAGGTPGVKNSVSGISTPSSPTLLAPLNNAQIIKTQSLDFTWQVKSGLKYEFILSENPNFSDYVVDEPNLSAGKFSVEDLSAGIYYWKVIASNSLGEASSGVFSFEISEPTYSNAMVVNELNPYPESGDEWIELYNNSADAVNLKDWILEDLKGSTHQYKISTDLIISAHGYITILKTQSGITLNNDSDGVRLIRPDGLTLYETPLFSGGKKSWGFARDSGGTWRWTTRLTPKALNIIVAPAVEEETKEEEDIPKNSTPIEIKTGDAQNYENYLVKIIGTVVETSGNTFYIDDGSGKVKIYIQAASGIDKPEMHKGDIFEIVGIVNFYRNVWRILPQNQEDIKLIQAKAEEETASEAKTKVATAAKTTTAAKSTTTTAKAPATTKKVASANAKNVANGNTEIAGYQSPLWINILKAFIALTGILLIILIVKLWRLKKEGLHGGHFGDDFT